MESRRYPELRIRFKAETGIDPMVDEVEEIQFYRSRGLWILHISDDKAMEMSGTIEKPVLASYTEYIEWLESQILNNNKR